MKYDNDTQAWMFGEADWEGDVQSNVGAFAPFTIDPARSNEEAELNEQYAAPWLILTEDHYGMVGVLTFETEELRDRRLLDLQNAFGLWTQEVSDETMIEVVGAYLSAAIFTATDGIDAKPELTWSGDAQRQASDDCIRFVIENGDAIRSFMAATGHGWTQIGIDFSLTRNRHGAGFWDRGAGESGADLTEAAHAYGETSVIIDDNGELAFA